MSAGLGRVGIRQRSAFVMACVASALFVAAVSMIASQIPSASRRTSAPSISAGSATRTTRGKGLPRRSFHFEIVPCGSASTNATRSPFSIAATASPTASVLLPLPPFCVTRARTYKIGPYQMRRRNTPRHESHQGRAWNSQLNPYPLRYRSRLASELPLRTDQQIRNLVGSPRDVSRNRHVERVFDPSRKEKHWGRRKLARDR